MLASEGLVSPRLLPARSVVVRPVSNLVRCSAQGAGFERAAAHSSEGKQHEESAPRPMRSGSVCISLIPQGELRVRPSTRRSAGRTKLTPFQDTSSKQQAPTGEVLSSSARRSTHQAGREGDHSRRANSILPSPSCRASTTHLINRFICAIVQSVIHSATLLKR
jgi:hypothetical protein